MSLDEDEDSGAGREAQFKSRMSRMIEKQKEVTPWRARDWLYGFICGSIPAVSSPLTDFSLSEVERSGSPRGIVTLSK